LLAAGGKVETLVADPGTVTLCDGTLSEDVLGTEMDPPLVDGGTVTVDVSVPAALRDPLVPARCADTLTARFELAVSSLFRIATKKIRSSTAPMRPSGMNAHFGKPSDSRGTSATTTLRSMTGLALMGRPQFGQATAELDISCPHSGQ
jgi:hypothetical protein